MSGFLDSCISQAPGWTAVFDGEYKRESKSKRINRLSRPLDTEKDL